MKKKLSETLAPMTAKEKFAYLWHYYKFYFLGGIALIGAAIFLFSQPPQKEIYLNIVLLEEKVNEGAVKELEADLNEELLTEEEREHAEVQIQVVPFSSEGMNPEANAGMQKFAAEMSTSSIDVLLVREEFFDELNEDGQLLALGGLGVGGEALKEGYPSPEGEIVGVDLADSDRLAPLVFSENGVLCVPSNSKRQPAAEKFLRTVFGENQES